MKIAGRKPLSFVLRIFVYTCAGITIGALGFLIAYILIKGVPHLSLDLFAWEYTSDNCSMVPAIINTFQITFFALFIAVPFVIGSAIYLVVYSKRGNQLVELV